MTTPGMNSYAAPPPTNGAAPNPSGNYRWGGPGRYSVPDTPESEQVGYEIGYSPELAAGGSPDGTMLPSDIRIGTREPASNDNNNRSINARRNSDLFRRVSDEQLTMGFTERQAKMGPPPQNPLWTFEGLPTRKTQTQSPMGRKFTRYWHIPRNIKDAVGEQAVDHFSLADHKRVTEIFGMKPQGDVGVNTYRAPVRPYDESIYVPPQPANLPSSATLFGNSAFRKV
jgi:hypothetical protein